MAFCSHLAGYTSPQALLHLKSLNSESYLGYDIACIQITLDTKLHSDCSLEGCTEEVHKFKSWIEAVTRHGEGGLSRRGGRSKADESSGLEEPLGSGQPLTFCDEGVKFLSPFEDGGLGGERTCTKLAEDSSDATTLSLLASSPAVTAADLSPAPFALFFGPEENPSSRIS